MLFGGLATDPESVCCKLKPKEQQQQQQQPSPRKSPFSLPAAESGTQLLQQHPLYPPPYVQRRPSSAVSAGFSCFSNAEYPLNFGLLLSSSASSSATTESSSSPPLHPQWHNRVPPPKRAVAKQFQIVERRLEQQHGTRSVPPNLVLFDRWQQRQNSGRSSSNTPKSAEQPRSIHQLVPGFWLPLGEGTLIKALSADEVDSYLRGNSLDRKRQEAEEVRKLAEKIAKMEEERNKTPEEKPQEYFIDDELGDFESSLAGRARLGRTHEDLNKCRQRIDMNAENQKEYSEIIAALQNKLLEYRRHIADLQRGASMPADTSLLPLSDSGFPGDMTTDWGAQYGRDANYNYNSILMRLDEERQRYDELRAQLDSERMHSDRLQADLIHFQRQFEQEMQEKDNQFRNREKSLTQYLSDEQKRVLDLWTELQRVRRQFSDLKDQTERELHEQRQEFNRIVRNVRSMVDGKEGTVGGTVVNTDSMIIEIIRRIKDRGNGDATGKLATDMDLLNKLRGGVDTTVEPELYQELIKKYEEAIERNIQLEVGGDENVRRVGELETDLRKTREKLAECQKAIRKINELSSRDNGNETRSRSLSPGNGPLVNPPEAVRNVRNALRNRDNEIQQLENRLRGKGSQIEELGTKLGQSEETKRLLEKELNGARRESSEMQRQWDDAERIRRRMEEKLKTMQNERKIAETMQNNLENEIWRLKQELEKAISEGKRKAQEEADDYAASMELDYKNRIDELNRRISALQEEKQRIKNELTPLRGTAKDLENEIKALKRKLDEKELQRQSSEEQKQRSMDEVGNLKDRLDILNGELDKSRNENDQMVKTINTLEQNMQSLKQQRDEQSKQREEVQGKLNEVVDAIRVEQSEKEQLRRNDEMISTEMDRLKSELNDLERQLIIARKHADELDAQQKTNVARQSTLENELSASRKETETMNELNQQLQRERQEAQNAKQEIENELARIQEQMRKKEQEMETMRKEISELRTTEAKSVDEADKQRNRADQLDSQLKEYEKSMKKLEEKMELMENEYKDKLKKASWRWKGGKSTTTTTDVGGTATTDTEEGEEGGGREAGTPEQGLYDSELVERKIKEIESKWKVEVERLENEKEVLERKVRDLEEKLVQMDRGDQRAKEELEDTKRRLQAEIDRLKGEVNNLHDKHQTELEEERIDHNKNMAILNREKEELEEKHRQAERRLAEALNSQSDFERTERDLKDRLDALTVQNQKLKDEMEDAKTELEKEIQKWKTDAYSMRSELKSLETTVANLKNQLKSVNDRNEMLNKTISDHVSKIRELTANARKLEEELSDARTTSNGKEVEVENLQNRLRQMEDQNQQMGIENGQLKNELERKLAVIESANNARKELEENVEKLKKRIEENEHSLKEQRKAVYLLKSDNARFQSALRDKNKEAEEWEKMANQFEGKLEKLRIEHQTAIEKLIGAENERENLRAKMSSLQKELDFGKEQILRRNEEYDAAIEAMSNAHRAAEDGRLAALHELESKKYDLANLESRLENAEQRLQQLQQEYVRVDNERELLADTLKRFQKSIGRAITDSNRFTAAEWNGKDQSQLESILKELANRIETLQRERNQFSEELNRFRQSYSDTNNTVNKRETHIKSIEETLESNEDVKRSLEARLATAKQLLRSQEETLKQREEERRQMKANLMTTDLDTRGKEAQLRHLNEQLKHLRADLDTAREELRIARDRTELQEGERYQLEGRLRDQDQELQKIRIQLTNSQTDNQNLKEKGNEVKGLLKLSDERASDLRDDVARLKRDLKRAEEAESELKRSLDAQMKNNGELMMLKEQMSRMQSELLDNQTRRSELETELTNARTEIREFKQRTQSLNSRISELQRQMQDTMDAKNRSEGRLHDLEKMSAHRIGESELKQQMDVLRNEKKQLKKEVVETRERLQQMKSEREAVGRAEEQCKRERAALSRKIEMYESEKRKTETAIRETALQREAIEKSLNTMERENRELYKNCAQLQQQVAQLEVENGHRLVEITNRQREEQEKHVQRIRIEKAQIEKMMENREKLCQQKIRQSEQQIQLLREQLEAERRRSRDFRDRQMASEAGRTLGMGRPIGTSPSGMTGYNSLGSYWPLRNDNIDSVGFRPFRSTYASNPLTPPRDASTPLATTTTSAEAIAQRQETKMAEEQGEVPPSTPLLSRARGFDQGSSSAYAPFPGQETSPGGGGEDGSAELIQLKYSPSGL